MNRRSLLVAAVAALAPAQKSKPLVFKPSDWEIKNYFEPVVDLCLRDPKELKAFLDQMDRVIGQAKLNQLTYRSMKILKPRLMSRRIVDRIVRRQLGV